MAKKRSFGKLPPKADRQDKPRTSSVRGKPFFEEVDTKTDFPTLEREILDFWYKKGIVKKYLQKNNSSKKNFSFLDGPITANNPMGVHHAWGRTYKDLFQRFKNMQGYKQRFQNGFDCQGLWVEVEVEKELGLKSKKDIENLVPGNIKKSIAKFVDLCKKRANKYAAIQTEQSKRLGYFMDWDNSYYTLSDDNNYMIWHFLKVCYENDWIYKGKDVVPWCPRCETAISQHEILTEDYKEVKHKSVYLKLPIENSTEHLLIWTTTPWTIPANTAVAVDKDLKYSLVEINSDEKCWVASESAERIFGKKAKVLKTAEGKKLVGLGYKSPYDYLPYVEALKPHKDSFHTVVATDSLIMPISAEEGTGLVHTSTGTGQEDYRFGKKIGLPVTPAINDRAEYLDGFGDLVGKNAKETPEIILDYLGKGGWVYKVEKYKHRYPVCWRCKSELVWKVTEEWYIAMDKPISNSKLKTQNSKLTLRKAMMRVAKRIHWIPGFGLERELDWLKNMHDWLISKKNRYWGLALPIFECQKCGGFEVIGSKQELRKRAISGWDKFDGHTPHKPWVDEVKIKCGKCGEAAGRVSDVGSPWLDAGIVAYSTITENNRSTPLYLKDKDGWRKWFPADFITESFPGQFKNWFYSLIAMSTVLENKEPFKTVLGFATLFDEDGRPMHKSLGNAIEFNEGADKIGVDVMRWMYVRQNPTDNLLFGYKLAVDTRRRFHLRLWNVYNFFVTYANADGWFPTHKGLRPGRVPSPNSKLKTQNSNVLDKWIITRLNQMVEGVTDNLEDYDAYSASKTIEKFVDDLSNWYVRRSRDRVGPAAELKKDKEAFYGTIYFVLGTLTKVLAPFTPYLADIIYKNLTKKESVHLTDWPKMRGKIDQKLLDDMANIRLVIEDAHAARKKKQIPVRMPLNSLVTISPYPLPPANLKIYVKDELNVKEWVVTKGNELKNKFDVKITPELQEEAKTRELIRKIQNERKKMGVKVTQKINVKSLWIPSSKDLIQIVLNKTLTRKLSKGNFKVTLTS